MICPLVFEPPNAELQTHIVYDDLVKEHATRELAKKMGAVYAGNAYKRKTKNPDKTIVYDYKRKKYLIKYTSLTTGKDCGYW